MMTYDYRIGYRDYFDPRLQPDDQSICECCGEVNYCDDDLLCADCALAQSDIDPVGNHAQKEKDNINNENKKERN